MEDGNEQQTTDKVRVTKQVTKKQLTRHPGIRSKALKLAIGMLWTKVGLGDKNSGGRGETN